MTFALMLLWGKTMLPQRKAGMSTEWPIPHLRRDSLMTFPAVCLQDDETLKNLAAAISPRIAGIDTVVDSFKAEVIFYWLLVSCTILAYSGQLNRGLRREHGELGDETKFDIGEIN
jgi:hypothetical protein